MLGETYEIKESRHNRYFMFQSLGPQGVIEKIVLFQSFGNGRYNLAFGDKKDNRLDDKVVSNNQDFVKVLSTVAKCGYLFVESNPGSIIEIRPVDGGRNMLYNVLFKRHYKTIQQQFEIFGFIENRIEPYDPDKNYDGFELRHKA